MTPSAYIENQLWFSTDAEGAIELQIRNHPGRHRGEVNMIHHPESTHGPSQKKIPLGERRGYKKKTETSLPHRTPARRSRLLQGDSVQQIRHVPAELSANGCDP